MHGFKDVSRQRAVAETAPIIALKMAGSAPSVVNRTVELATALGATPTARQD
ncbi:hypothetical protein [Amycolatopsis sp.]|uniref:hypothetical protein n=1 Tax=Amycolatopsis sp. TaxID=37632 RepID=UPI002C1F773E|nr:hypothetical protein [Amycolatopsis sp.]HVV10969.1 hypothetical protein [Amycolatopsis sp.]